MNQTEPKLLKWPFFLGDAVLVGLAYFVYSQHKLPMTPWEIAFFVASGALGAFLGVAPFLLEYRAAMKLSATHTLAATIAQIQNIEQAACQIGAATAQWQIVQQQSAKTVGTAKEVAERMGAEAAAFTEFLRKANDSEKATLRLEVEKLRRAEGDWLQIIVRLLDHTYALHQAAVRSGQAGVIEQLTNFQNACRDVARRVGLVAFAPAPNDAFDAQWHQLADPQVAPPADAQVGETIATGYTFQGQLLRPALVALQSAEMSVKEILQRKQPAALEVADKPATPLLEEQALL
jgi:molecular chaperone GrpE (heat shock protein)